MSLLCKKCGITFADKEAKHLHYVDAFKEISYDTRLQEQKSQHYLRCICDTDLIRYYERNEQKVYHLKQGAKERIVEDRRFISLDELHAILAQFDILATDVIRQLPDASIRGNRSKPSGIEKIKALEVARALYLDS